MKQYQLFINPFRELENYAVVIIDMQPHFLFGKQSSDTKDETKVAEVCLWQQQLIDEYRRTQRKPVIFIEYDNGFGKFGDTVFPVQGSDYKIKKSFDDAILAILFSNTVNTEKPNDLEEVLGRLNTQSVVVLGCNAEACVLDSISSLRRKGFQVYTSRNGLLSQSSDTQRLEYALGRYSELGVHVH